MTAKALFLAMLTAALIAPRLFAQDAIFIVRHAEKAADGDATNPPLSPAGEKRAEQLLAVLNDAGVEAVYATEFTRTQQTAAPFARAKGIEVSVVPAKDTAALVNRLKTTKGNALVVAHSNTIPEIIRALGIGVPVTLGEHDYDNLFVVVPGSPPVMTRLHIPMRLD